MIQIGPFVSGIACATLGSMYYCVKLNENGAPKPQHFDNEKLEVEYRNRLYKYKTGQLEGPIESALASRNSAVGIVAKQIDVALKFIKEKNPLN